MFACLMCSFQGRGLSLCLCRRRAVALLTFTKPTGLTLQGDPTGSVATLQLCFRLVFFPHRITLQKAAEGCTQNMHTVFAATRQVREPP